MRARTASRRTAPLARRLAVWGAIALYVAAAFGASGLHVHNHAGPCTASACRHETKAAPPAHRCCGHRHACPVSSKSTTSPQPARPANAPLHDDDCSACRFLAQKPLPPQAVIAVELVDSLPEPPTARPIWTGAAPLFVPEVRGPPRV